MTHYDDDPVCQYCKCRLFAYRLQWDSLKEHEAECSQNPDNCYMSEHEIKEKINEHKKEIRRLIKKAKGFHYNSKYWEQKEINDIEKDIL